MSDVYWHFQNGYLPKHVFTGLHLAIRTASQQFLYDKCHKMLLLALNVFFLLSKLSPHLIGFHEQGVSVRGVF